MSVREKEKKPSAMKQVHNKVNAGIMDAVAYGGMCEAADPEDEEYQIGMEDGGLEPYAHVKEGKKTMFVTEEQLRQMKILLEADDKKENQPDYQTYVKSFIKFLRSQHLSIDPLPEIELNDEEQDGLFIKTGYYSPDERKIVAFTNGRHIKDVMRTIAHEFIHHMQNVQDPDKDWGSNGDLEQDRKLRGIEGEAYLLGNILFREWTEYARKNERNLNESRISESPDNCMGINWHLEDAVPFMVYLEDGKFYVDYPGRTHGDMLRKLGVSEDTVENLDDLTFAEHVEVERTGRYWPMNNVISLWETPVEHQWKLINVVSQLSDHIDMDLKYLVVDYWEKYPAWTVPYKWFLNGTLSMLLEIGVDGISAVDPYEYRETGKYTKFFVKLKDGRGMVFDINGDIVPSEYQVGSESLNEATDEIVEPDDVDLSSFNIKKHLNPKFWDDGHLDTRIRLRLLDIADDFFDSLGVDWVEPEDVIITGSIANYNWNSEHSDIDLHILVDYEDVDERVDFVREYFTLKKNEWNDKHKGLRIFGFPVEVYVQDANEPHASSGVYSIDRDEWITEPDREKLRSGKVDKRHVREMVSTYMNKIDNLIDIYKRHKDDEYEMRKVADDAAEMMSEIKKLRKDDLAKYNREMCDGNIIFKALRRSDYIGKLIKLKNLAYDKINSL